MVKRRKIKTVKRHEDRYIHIPKVTGNIIMIILVGLLFLTFFGLTASASFSLSLEVQKFNNCLNESNISCFEDIGEINDTSCFGFITGLFGMIVVFILTVFFISQEMEEYNKEFGD